MIWSDSFRPAPSLAERDGLYYGKARFIYDLIDQSLHLETKEPEKESCW